MNVIPKWVKNNAGWWAEGVIDDISFVSGIQFLIEAGIMNIPETEKVESTNTDIPDWVKHNAGWWADDLISDDDFADGLKFLISNGIIIV